MPERLPELSLGELTPARFLSEYWQRKPLLIKRAVSGFGNPLSGDELAGLACEESVESRLIINRRSDPWQLRHGPFEPRDFAGLPETGWTLHIQSVDAYLEEIYALADCFRFIPNWRIDDVMASYAPNLGSAGPHYDQYDVFLLQTLGKKRWQLGQVCDAQTPLQQHTELRILESFQVRQTFLAEPGDLLYIPPNLAHFGIAEGESITYSVGFRAPAYADMLADYSHVMADQLDDCELYQDPGLEMAENPGEISHPTLAFIQTRLLEQMADKQQFARWFGRYISEPKNSVKGESDGPDLSLSGFREALAQAKTIKWQEGSRFAYIEQAEHIDFFINGDAIECSPDLLGLVRKLCTATGFAATELSEYMEQPRPLELLFKLYHREYLYLA